MGARSSILLDFSPEGQNGRGQVGACVQGAGWPGGPGRGLGCGACELQSRCGGDLQGKGVTQVLEQVQQ